jgi:hypothetical protein
MFNRVWKIGRSNVMLSIIVMFLNTKAAKEALRSGGKTPVNLVNIIVT